MQREIEIPHKSSFKINEVCAITGIKSYVLRFWESEFQEIAPLVSSSGQKIYEQKDIEAILLIKKLLFQDKFTIEKAKAEMKRLMPSHSSIDPILHNFEENCDAEEIYSNDEQIDKLLVAKSKLNSILELTESLKRTHNWN